MGYRVIFEQLEPLTMKSHFSVKSAHPQCRITKWLYFQCVERRTVELFDELPTDCLAEVRSEMVLSIGRDDVALWSGRGHPRYCAIDAPSSYWDRQLESRTRYAREREVLDSYLLSDSRRLLLCPRVVGRGSVTEPITQIS